MNILKDNLSGIASKSAYTAPMMEVVVMNHHTDLLECSPCSQDATDNIGDPIIGIEEG